MIQCPECRALIPDDSAFCDQCGKELMWCPECKRPKRGHECPVCGSDLVPGRKYLAGDYEKPGSTPPQTTSPSAPPQAPSQPPQNGPQPTAVRFAPQGTTASAPAKPSKLVGSGMALTLQAGAFGRRGGIWPELGTCQYVSGSHGEISQSPAGDWMITDVGSTNGTFINGSRLAPSAKTPLKKGDMIKIATLEFVVE